MTRIQKLQRAVKLINLLESDLEVVEWPRSTSGIAAAFARLRTELSILEVTCEIEGDQNGNI